MTVPTPTDCKRDGNVERQETDMRGYGTVVAVAALLLGVTGCGARPGPASEAPLAEPDPASVPFELAPLKAPAGKGKPAVWLATHTANGKKAAFRIELVLKEPAQGGELPFAFTSGAFYRETGSDSTELLKALQSALEADKLPPPRKQQQKLAFDAAILGLKLSRGGGSNQVAGAFSTEPAGDWIATKLFLADGQAEVYLNLNPTLGRGEFSLKDPEYADAVLRELARVL
jgi:hypothetical protein